MDKQIQYWQVPLPEWDFPIRITERFNCALDSGTSDWALHWHEQLEFQYVLAGAIELNCNGKKQWIYPGDIFFANWCEPHHALAFVDGTHYYVFQVDLSWLIHSETDLRLSKYSDIMLVHSQDFSSFIYQDSALSRLFLDLLQEYQNKSPGFDLMVKGYFLKIIALLFRDYFHPKESFDSHDRTMGYTRQVLNYIAHHYNETLNLDTLAVQAGVSKSHLCHIFKKHMGCTIIRYINQLRCYRALSMISSGASVTKASTEVGYNDYNYFSRVFREITGLSPSEVFHKAAKPETRINREGK